MKVLIAAVVTIILGLAAAVVINEQSKGGRPAGPAIDEAAVVSTISTGQEVDILAHIPRDGLTILEFTADF